MADTIGELLVRVGLDNAQFKEGLEQMDRSMRLAKAEFQTAAAQMGDFGSATDRLKSKADYLNKQIEIQKQKVTSLTEAFKRVSTSKEADSAAAEKLQIKMLQAQKVIANMENELKRTTKEIDSQATALGRLKYAYEQAAAEAKQKMGNAFESIKNAGQKITLAGAAVAGGLGLAVKTSADFDTQMSKVLALSGATGDEFQMLRQQAIDLGAQTTFSASESASAMQQLAAAGMSANQIFDAMPGVLSAAAASGEDIALVSETMASTLGAFRLEASKSSHIADVLAQAANSSAISIGDMANSLKYASPVANSLGISLEEVGAALVEMGNAGIKSEQAGTTLRGALTRLADPPKEAAQAISNLGISIADSSGKMRPLADIIGQLNEKTKGMTDVQKSAAISQIFGTEALSGMLVLVNSGKDQFDQYTNALRNCDGAAKTAADTMTNNLGGATEQLKGALESAGISIGTALEPAIRKIAEAITAIIEKFNNLPAPIQKAVAILGAVAAGIALITGPILILVGLLPSISAGFATLGGTLGLTAGATGGVGAALAGIAAPIAAAIAIVVALVATIKDLWQNNEAFRNKVGEIWADIQAIVTRVGEAIKAFWNKWGADIAAVLQAVWNIIKAVFQTAVQVIVDVFGVFLDILQGDWQGAWEHIKNIFTELWEGLKTVVINAFNGLKTLGSMLLGIGKDVINYFINGAKSKSSAIAEFFKSIPKTISEFFAKLPENIGYLLGLLLAKFAKFGVDAINWVKNDVPKIIDSIIQWFKELPGKIAVALKEAIVTLGKWAVDAIAWAKTEVPKIVENIITFFKDLPGKLLEIGVQMVEGLWNGIKSKSTWLAQQVSNFVNGIKKGFTDGMEIKSPSKVMYEYGQYISEGLGLGIQDGLGFVKDSVSDIIATLVDMRNSLEKITAETNAKLLEAEKEYADQCREVRTKLAQDEIALQQELSDKLAQITAAGLEKEAQAIEAYNQSYAAKVEFIKNQIGLFDEVKPQKVSGQTLLGNLENQVNQFDNWQANLKELAAKGVDEGLIDELRQMGVKAAPQVAALNTLTAEELSKYVGLWKTKNAQARAEANIEMRQAKADLTQRLSEIRAETQNQLQQQTIEMQNKLMEMKAKADEELAKYKKAWEEKNGEIKKNAAETITTIEKKYEEIVKKSSGYGIQAMSELIRGIRSRMTALQEVMDEVRSIMGSGMDPNQRNSPSLVEKIKIGVADITAAYSSLKNNLINLDLKSALIGATPLAIGGVTTTNSSSTTINKINITVNGGAADVGEQIYRTLLAKGVRFSG